MGVTPRALHEHCGITVFKVANEPGHDHDYPFRKLPTAVVWRSFALLASPRGSERVMGARAHGRHLATLTHRVS
jgi:hypothetical protein